MHARVLPAAHEKASVVERLDAIEPSFSPREHNASRVRRMQRVHLTVPGIKRHDDPALSLWVPCNSIGPAQDVPVCYYVDGSVRTDGKYFVAPFVDHSDFAHQDARIGDIDSAIRANSDVVEQHRAPWLQIDLAKWKA